jgi:propionyl-CoA carboxylase alpha chain
MISKVLVANRGEIARRIFRTCRDMGIATVAVYSDADHGEPHMREADEAVRLPGTSSADTYLDIEAILSAGLSTSADAVHPGYGFLAENAAFARAVIDAGLIWIGPPAKAIETMGSKLESKRLMESAGVPILGSAELTRHVDATAAADQIGYPVLVKASAGGGGKGMRIVEEPGGLNEAIDGARREAASAFGDDTVFLEKYLEEPRHIEIQVFGDTHGRVVSLHERECSIQRRHQKIIEESPSPVIGPEMRQQMGAAAVRAAEAVEYVGAGTVEFLYQDKSFYFLEMNTRLQVEHPVTEMVTGLDLVRMQIEVANGDAIPEWIPPITGHAIEVRLYAEDALNDFLPVTGTVHRFSFDQSRGVRVDAGVDDESNISVHYDPMIAKVIAHAATRGEAASTLAAALRKARLHTSTTNRALLVRILESEEFLEGETDTHFLRRHDPAVLGRPLADPDEERLAAIAVAIADQAKAREQAPVLASIPSGWRNSRGQPQMRSYEGFHGVHDIRYTLDRQGFHDDQVGQVRVIEAHPTSVTLYVAGAEHRFEIARYGPGRFADFEETPVRLTEVPRFPRSGLEHDAGSLHAPMPGKVIRVEVSEGDHVVEGQILVVLEAMKMEHTLRSPHAGTVADVLHADGDQVEGGAVLVVVDADS